MAHGSAPAEVAAEASERQRRRPRVDPDAPALTRLLVRDARRLIEPLTCVSTVASFKATRTMADPVVEVAADEPSRFSGAARRLPLRGAAARRRFALFAVAAGAFFSSSGTALATLCDYRSGYDCCQFVESLMLQHVCCSYWAANFAAVNYNAYRIDQYGTVTYFQNMPNGGNLAFNNGSDAYRRTSMRELESRYSSWSEEADALGSC